MVLISFISAVKGPIIYTAWAQIGEQVVYRGIEQIGGSLAWDYCGYQIWEQTIEVIKERQFKDVRKLIITQTKIWVIEITWNELIWQIWLVIWSHYGNGLNDVMGLFIRIGFEWATFYIFFPRLESCYHHMLKKII